MATISSRVSDGATIYLIDGPYHSQQSFTKLNNMEVGIYGKHHRWCGNCEVHVYRRKEENSNQFEYAGIDAKDEDCTVCEKGRENERIRKEKEEFQRSIEVVFQIGDGGYEWSEAQIGTSPDGRLWYRYGSGCSCNSIDEEEWMPLNEVVQAKQACQHIGDSVDRAHFIGKAQTLIGERK